MLPGVPFQVTTRRGRIHRQLRVLLASLVLLFGPALLAAQSLDAASGVWDSDALAFYSSAGITSPLWAPLDYGVSVFHVEDHRSLVDRTQTGAEISLGAGRDGSGFYLLGSAGLGFRHRDGNFDAAWTAGAGVAARPLSFLSLAVESRYRVEDQFSRGFWRLDPSDRRGWMVLGRVSILFSGRTGSGARPVLSPRAVERTARARGLDNSSLAAQIVATAVQAMGTPYRWGGDDSNGYDCSGLIQFAYAEQGIALPRVSREQAAYGRPVTLDVDQLAPGDILGFAVDGDRISHVGLYVGNGEFIHSAASGVKLSSLTADDPDSRWWQERWAGARRVLH